MKQFIGRLKNFRPKALPTCSLALLFSCLSLYIVIAGKQESIAAGLTYAIYALAAVSLALAVWALVLAWRRAGPIQRLRQQAAQREFTRRLMEDDSFRAVAVNHAALAANLVFAVLRTVMGVALHSTWFGVLAGYYIILCIARLLLVRNSRKHQAMPPGTERTIFEWKLYRITGLFIALTTLFLQAAVLHLVYTTQGYHYDFWKFISAVVYLFRTARKRDRLVQSIKNLSLASALVGILALQSAMFASFGSDTNLTYQRRMNAATGTAVCLCLIVLGVYMFWRACRELNRISSTSS